MDCEYTTDGYELEPCPFCCSTIVELWIDHVECENCNAHGPTLSSWEVAVRAWNEMPRPTGDRLKKQRSRWKSRLRADVRKAQQVAADVKKARQAEAERHKVWSEERKAWVSEVARDREYRKWTAAREAWLHAPVKVSNDG